MGRVFVLLAILAASVVAQGHLNSTDASHRTDLRIVFGQNARLGLFPWQAYAQCVRTNYMSTSCGGSLISTRHILTAAHCVLRVVRCQVSLGLVSLRQRGYSYFVSSSDIIIHGMYNNNQYGHDIAIIRLPSTIQLTAYIQPIRLAKTFQNSGTLSGASAVVSGWGKTRDDEKGVHDLLQYAIVRIMQANRCKAFFTSNFGVQITNGQICAEFSKSNVCNGDSGGPLAIHEQDNIWTLIGVVSLGISPCEDGKPSVFTAVGSYLPWIVQNAR